MRGLLQEGWRPAALFRQTRRPLNRIAGFGALIGVSALSNLVVLPVLSARFGQPGWSSVLLGHSIGAAASVLCALAWPMEGPHLASNAEAAQRRGLYKFSVRQRGVAIVAITPILVGVCVAAQPSMLLVCVLCAFGSALNALSPAWYFVGTSRPSQSLIAEGVPRFAVNLAAIALVAFLPLWTYPVALIAGMLATLAITSYFVHREPSGEGHGLHPEHGQGIRPSGGRFPLLASIARGADGAYSYLTGPLVALIAPPAYPLYAAVDRLGQIFINVLASVTNGLTAWVGEAGGKVRHRRVDGAVLLAGAVAGLVLIVLWAGAPMLLDYLFAGTVAATSFVAFLAAAIVAGVFLSRTLSLVLLVPRGLVRNAYRLLLAGACLGLSFVGVSAFLAGSVGALAAAAVLPWLVVAVQLTMGMRVRPAPPGDGA